MPWYQTESVAILALLICPPLGVALTWLYQRWSTPIKAGASLLSLCHRRSREVVQDDYLAGDDGRERHRAPAACLGQQPGPPVNATGQDRAPCRGVGAEASDEAVRREPGLVEVRVRSPARLVLCGLPGRGFRF